MAGTLEKELTDDNVRRYVKAAVDIANSIDLLADYGYRNILIPSRGAYPFFKLAWTTRLPHNRFEGLQVVVLPFTATDIEGHTESSSDIRKYWVNVYLAMLDNKPNLSLDFYRYILSDVFCLGEGESAYIGDVDQIEPQSTRPKRTVSSFFPKTLQNSGTVFIDTVISGMAASTILKEFEARELDYHALLILDAAGTKLAEPYKSYLEKLELEGRVEFFEVPRIFTEDRGPGLLGVTSITYPGLMLKAADSGLFHGEDFSIPGAGIWLEVPYKKEFDTVDDDPMFRGLSPWNFSNRVIDIMLLSELRRQVPLVNDLTPEISDQLYEYGRRQLISVVNGVSMLDPDSTPFIYSRALEASYRKLGIRPMDVNATRSHIIEVRFSPEDTNKIYRKFLSQKEKR